MASIVDVISAIFIINFTINNFTLNYWADTKIKIIKPKICFR